MAARSKARKRALDVLFESEQRGVDPLATLAQRVAESDPPVNDYTVTLVEGVCGSQREIDQAIGSSAREWSAGPDACGRPYGPPAGRLGAAPRRRPSGVAIDEAVELAKQLSTDESPAFVNGVLARVLEAG